MAAAGQVVMGKEGGVSKQHRQPFLGSLHNDQHYMGINEWGMSMLGDDAQLCKLICFDSVSTGVIMVNVPGGNSARVDHFNPHVTDHRN